MILLAFGTRPEAIKLGPVAAELASAKVPFGTLCTGQHKELLAGTPAESDLAGPHALGLPSNGNVLKWLKQAERAALQWLAAHPEFDIVVVQGDTMSALAVARAAYAHGDLLAHVEAGVRSHWLEEPWPEERNRTEIAELADWHYAPTAQAFANLVQERVPETRIRLTGNPVVSALARYTVATPRPPLPHILVTLHRREWLLGPTVPETLQALADAAREEPRVEFIWPLHPAVAARLDGTQFPGNVTPTRHLEYTKCSRVLASALGVLTDSGGLQEEAATLGVPCAVLRRVLDRPESVEAGIARRFDPDAAGVKAAVGCLLHAELARRPTDLYGDPASAARIAQHLSSLVPKC